MIKITDPAERAYMGLPLRAEPTERGAGEALDDLRLRPDTKQAPPAKSSSGNESDEKPKDPTTAEKVVRLALELFEIGRTDTDDAFAIRKNGPRIAMMFRGSKDALRATLAREYRLRNKATPCAAALADALTTLQGEALETEPREVHLRVAPEGEKIIIDLGRIDGQVVEISARGWVVSEQSAVIFRRTALTGELPLPTFGGNLDELRKLLNVTDEAWPLLRGWLAAAFLPSIPHPVLMLDGQQGAGKTTAARVIVGLIDPSPAPLRSQPNDVEGWAMAASGSWVVAIDNVSTIPGWWSDCLCRAVTGDGWVRRKLYTDSELSVLAFRRVVALTSIDAGAFRGDLGDRLLLIDLEAIAGNKRRSEADLDRALATSRARMFGALLTQVSEVLKALPNVKLDTLPRMADFARVLAALDMRCDAKSLPSYLAQRGRVVEDVLEADSIAEAVRSLEGWEGTAGELLNKITSDGIRPQGWPRNGRALVARLKRLVPALRQVGVEINFHRERTAKGRVIGITKTSSQQSEHSLTASAGA